jgi:MacB-like protein
MKHLRRIFLRIYLLFTNSRAEAELAREIAAHLALLEDEYLRQGMNLEEARRAAGRAYGGVEQAKQLHRNERAFQGLAQTIQDIRYTFRQLRKSPGFTATAVLMLALGIGATTAIFSIVEGVLLRSLPFPDPNRLVILGDVLEGSTFHSSVTPPDIRNYMRDTQSFAHLGGYRGRGFELSGMGDPLAVNATRMSGEVFAALGVGPLLGRAFTQREDEEHQQVAVLSYGMWQTHFHGDVQILGNKILLDRKPYTVIGVMPRNFEFPLNPGHLNQTELWVPLSLQTEEFTGGSAASWNLRMVGRLKPGITAEQAQSDAERVARETMQLSGLHAQPSHSLGGDAAARGHSGAGASLGADAAFCCDRRSADRLREPGRPSAGAIYPSAKRNRGQARAGCAGGNVAATGHRREYGIEHRRGRDRAGAGCRCSAGGREPVAGDHAACQGNWLGLAGHGFRPGAVTADRLALRTGSSIRRDPNKRQ